MTPRTFPEGAATAIDHAYGDPERVARQLGNTRAVAKAHYIDVPETVPDNRDVLERWARGTTGPKTGDFCENRSNPSVSPEQKTPSAAGRKGFSLSG
ncbi:hypothetical protein [Nocardia gipuzkoensis]|uniref:hypothetical protein n=1 Tax=Nocardia gipuzkoensis TaxID=2749991 RepID=UPI00237DA495|nr:hypothetical protein [Nocardia gipuzkoensis]MDE1674844.1 hypothetical protein [Nocardia gipuzkoensis]